MKKCPRIVGYKTKFIDGIERVRSVVCAKDAPIEVLGFVESPFMRNHYQVEKYWVCEEHAEESLNRSSRRKQEIIDSGGKFVRIDAGENNAMHHIPIDVP